METTQLKPDAALHEILLCLQDLRRCLKNPDSISKSAANPDSFVAKMTNPVPITSPLLPRITPTMPPISPEPPDPPCFNQSDISATKAAPKMIETSSLANNNSKTDANNLPRRYSCEEIYERMEMGLCVFCDEPDITGHYLKHKRSNIFMIECNDDELCDDKELVEPVVEGIVDVEETKRQKVHLSKDPYVQGHSDSDLLVNNFGMINLEEPITMTTSDVLDVETLIRNEEKCSNCLSRGDRVWEPGGLSFQLEPQTYQANGDMLELTKSWRFKFKENFEKSLLTGEKPMFLEQSRKGYTVEEGYSKLQNLVDLTWVKSEQKQLGLSIVPRFQILQDYEAKLHGYNLLGAVLLRVQCLEKQKKLHKTRNFKYKHKTRDISKIRTSRCGEYMVRIFLHEPKLEAVKDQRLQVVQQRPQEIRTRRDKKDDKMFSRPFRDMDTWFKEIITISLGIGVSLKCSECHLRHDKCRLDSYLNIQKKLQNKGIFAGLCVVRGNKVGHDKISTLRIDDEMALTVAEAVSLKLHSQFYALRGASFDKGKASSKGSKTVKPYKLADVIGSTSYIKGSVDNSFDALAAMTAELYHINLDHIIEALFFHFSACGITLLSYSDLQSLLVPYSKLLCSLCILSTVEQDKCSWPERDQNHDDLLEITLRLHGTCLPTNAETTSTELRICATYGFSEFQRFSLSDSGTWIKESEMELQQLNDLKSMVESRKIRDAIDQLQANYVDVKAEIDRGLTSIEQFAILDIITVGCMAVEVLKTVLGFLVNGMALERTKVMHATHAVSDLVMLGLLGSDWWTLNEVVISGYIMHWRVPFLLQGLLQASFPHNDRRQWLLQILKHHVHDRSKKQKLIKAWHFKYSQPAIMNSVEQGCIEFSGCLTHLKKQPAAMEGLSQEILDELKKIIAGVQCLKHISLQLVEVLTLTSLEYLFGTEQYVTSGLVKDDNWQAVYDWFMSLQEFQAVSNCEEVDLVIKGEDDVPLVFTDNLTPIKDDNTAERDATLDRKMLQHHNISITKFPAQWKEHPPDQATWTFYKDFIEVQSFSSLRTRMF